MKKLSAADRQRVASLGGTARAANLSEEEISGIARKAGLAGGKARAEKLTAKQRSEIARKAAAARWAKKKLND
jgi:hypothetical protein